MREHSPLPWSTIHQYIFSGDRAIPIASGHKEYATNPNGELYAQALANAAFIVKAVNSHDVLVNALENVRRIIVEGAMTGFNYKDGDWAERLFESQQVTSAALASLKEPA